MLVYLSVNLDDREAKSCNFPSIITILGNDDGSNGSPSQTIMSANLPDSIDPQLLSWKVLATVFVMPSIAVS